MTVCVWAYALTLPNTRLSNDIMSHKYDRRQQRGHTAGMSPCSTLKEKNSTSLSLSVSFSHVKINETNISQSACLIVFCFENWEGEPPQNNHTHKESVKIQTKNNVSKIHSHTWRQYLHFRHQLFYSKATHNCNFKSQGRELNWHSEEIGKIQMNNNIVVSSCHADCKKGK